MKQILAVDDNATNNQLIISTLGSLGYQVIAVGGAREALDWLDSIEHMPAVILCDVYMPDMDGLSLIKILKSQDRSKEIPVIVVTAAESGRLYQELLDSGALSILRKPVHVAELYKLLVQLRVPEDDGMRS
jgi:CheY-like chemotaxis protein